MASIVSQSQVTKEGLFDQLSQCGTEDQFIRILILISNELNKKGYLLQISKNEIVSLARSLRKSLQDSDRKIWSKSVAKLFGVILKKLKQAETYSNLKLVQEFQYFEGILHKFGKLSKEDYSETRVINCQNFINTIKINMVKCGGQSSIILSSDGDIYTAGDNGFGQLGHGNCEGLDEFKKVENIPQCKYISSGYAFQCAITVSGDIYSWGAGENGRLGNGTKIDINIPTKIEIDVKFKIIEAGSVHMCAISENNELYSCGDKKYNGHNIDEDLTKIKKIHYFDGMFFNLLSIGPGGYHTLALNIAGKLFTWGHNRVGQLGLGNNSGSVIIDDGDHILPSPHLVESLNGIIITDINAGWGHSAVVSLTGNIYMCGRNSRGQLGIDRDLCMINSQGHDYLPNFTLIKSLEEVVFKKVVCGGELTGAITKDGELYLWGCDSNGQLGGNIDLESKYGIDNKNYYYDYQPTLVEGEPYIGKVFDISLGSSVTYLLTYSD